LAADTETLLAPQFTDLTQQRETSELGMWVFLMTELLLFGALFTSYAVYRFRDPGVFAEASRDLEAGIGAINTAVLITSSLGMALAVSGAQTNDRRRLLGGLITAILLGTVFMVLKGVEYYHHYEHQEFPGLAFNFARPHAPEVQVFFFLYFAMTGLHAVHLTIGICLVTVLLIQAVRGRYSALYYTPVELAGLYWHFVDIVWIFLFPLLYLIGGRR
jgi:cytochrome c oxidase subunit 3